ncbi:putative nucleotidyltransferase, Ribonuclease H [Rosa chinensis]|uniref:Putative nucleotidyltransferase, Ribonuclease H n=1 Tax=Rosa chinensis TaxID=74649 RepID=A0A2P6PKQ3_ROSCH|nr:putative nucleotidyltransferase, Ribonuclease H [Rosa chinensis]
MTLRGLQNPTPSIPFSSALVDPPPSSPTPLHQPSSSTSVSDTQALNLQNTIEFLQNQNEDLHTSFESFQNRMSAQFAALQNTVVASLVHRPQPPVSNTCSTPASGSPQIIFGSLNSASPIITPPCSTTGTTSSISPSSSTIPPESQPNPPPQSTPPPQYSWPYPPHYYSHPPISPLAPPPGFHSIPGPSSSAVYSTITSSISDPIHSAPHPHLFPPQPVPPYKLLQTPYPHQDHTFRPPKIDLPRFTGDDAVGWVAMAERYLRVHRIPLHEQVAMVSSHFGPDASVWMNAFEQRHPFSTWDLFITAFLEHFGAGSNTDFKSQLSHLQQWNSVDEFITEFTKLSCRAPEWSDEQLLPIFLGGLKPEIRHDVMAMEPRSLSHAHRLARRYEAKVKDLHAATSHTFRSQPWSYGRPVGGPHHSPFPAMSHGPTPTTQPPNSNLVTTGRPAGPYRRYSTAEQRDRREKGLCYTCDEPYSKYHVCKRPFLAIMEAPTATTTEELSEFHDAAASLEDPPVASAEILPLHAITESAAGDVMRIDGSILNTPIRVFIDCGSASNFLNPVVAQRLGLQIHHDSQLTFTSASGHPLQPMGTVRNVTVKVQSFTFTDDFFLLPVTGCDLVLGAKWLNTLGFIGWHFAEKVMVFFMDGQCYTLHGLSATNRTPDTSGLLALVQAEQSSSLLQTGIDPVHTLPQCVQDLLSLFDDLFQPPTRLPPKRAIDHRITLLPNSGPVNVRPYRYAHSQKDELEAQVQEMLQAGLIRPSSSPYSSPVLLVKKKEGTWRFCVDYRGLNAVTVKDRFPIPVVDELLDELHGATYFTKLDLRSGYHQIRMHEDDIEKTAFRTHDGHFEFVVMPFGLTNAPSTFQALMNHIFKPLLRKFVLVFFDDILIFSSDLLTHLSHITHVFELLRANNLKLKLSKCALAKTQVEYLGHVVSAKGVEMDPSKIKCITDWPKPKSVKSLRGFLGLAGYYRRFVPYFGVIAQPLTAMLKTDNFQWNPASEQAFERLKQAIISAPVLALPDFTKPFVVETDASGSGIGAVLTQEKHPVAFLSKSLSPNHQAMSTYDREMFAVMYAIDKWRPYLLGNSFKILTDHQTLKHLMDQRISTPAQHKWIAKLLGYNYTIEYKAGNTNTVPDILSRRHELCAIQTVSSPVFDSIYLIDRACQHDPSAQAIIQALKDGIPTNKNFKLHQGRLFYKDRIFVPETSEWRSKLLLEFHASLQAGHSGYLRTLTRLSRNFAWPGMRKDVKLYVASCDQCQRQKYESIHPPGLLQPLPIPDHTWEDISMDFVEGLPDSQGYNAIMVVVDRLSKYAHFVPVSHPFTASQIADTFMKHIFKLHGMPKRIVSDRDPVFLSHFWTVFFKLQGTQLCHSSAYHPQSDGQSEVVNRSLEHFLRCFVLDKPSTWKELLHWAEWWNNTTFHSTIRMSPFEALYGHPPPSIEKYLPGSTKVNAVDSALQTRDLLLQNLKSHMAEAQNRMKQIYDKGHTEREFTEGDWVFLKLHPYRQRSLLKRSSHKLAPRYYGPFQVVKKIGTVAYHLKLPPSSRLHPVFHVSLLKRRIGDDIPVSPTLPQFDNSGEFQWQPLKVLDMGTRSLNKKRITTWLIQWKGLPVEDATWEDAHDIAARFPVFCA